MSKPKQEQEEDTSKLGSLQDFRLVKMMTQKSDVGPTTYRPRVDYSSKVPTAPKVSFGKQSRFLQSKSVFISHHHNADMMGVHSPGPKYWPPRPDKPRPPALSWGEVMDPQKMQRREMLRSRGLMAEVGPAAYDPSTSATKPAAPRVTFGRGSRFADLDKSMNESDKAHLGTSNVAPGMQQAPFSTEEMMAYPSVDYHTAMKAVRKRDPAFSFGLDTAGSPAPFKVARETGKVLTTNRTHFITHSIQGGSAKSATFEAGIGPDHYMPGKGKNDPQHGWNYDKLLPHPVPAMSFGKAMRLTKKRVPGEKEDRFEKPVLTFISAEHAKANVGWASPGPKYLYDGDSLGKHKKDRTGTLKWVP